MTDKPITIEHFRKAIDAADEIILRALAARFRAVEHLRDLKREAKMQVESSSREDALKKVWKQRAKELKIPEELALLILDFILAESKRIQSEQ